MQRRPNADEFLTRDTRAVRPVQNPFAKLRRGSHVCGAPAATRSTPAVAARRVAPVTEGQSRADVRRERKREAFRRFDKCAQPLGLAKEERVLGLHVHNAASRRGRQMD